jgi:membrane protein
MEASARADYAPKGTDARPSLFATVKRTFTEFSEDNMTDWAAALTYYGLLSLFPALIALVSIIGLVGDPATITRQVTDIVTSLGPKSAAQTFAGPIKSITANKSAAGILLIVSIATALWSASGYVGAFMRASNIIYETPEGRPIWKLRPLQVLVTLVMLLLIVSIATALWSASGYVGAFMRASNIIYETPEGRPIWKLRPLQVLVTLVMLLLIAVVALALVLSGPLVKIVADPIGIGSTAQDVWNYGKWPVLILVVITMFSVLYYAAPNVKLRGFKWVTPGVVLALVVWLIASAAFAFYVANFGSYDKTYGTLGGLVVLLIWMWITNVSLLLGMELNAERERAKELAAGDERADKEIQLEPRDEPKDEKTT